MIRRQFLKLCLMGLQTALFHPLFEISTYAKEKLGGRHVSRHTKKFLKGIPSLCHLCPARCGIIGYLDGDRLVKIGGNVNHPNSLGKICSKGLAGLNLAYDPERLTSPMIRRGKRGEGKWEKISWERAYKEVLSWLKPIYQRGNKGDLVFQSEYEPQGLIKKFFEAFGKAITINEQSLYYANRDLGNWFTWGERRGIPDIANSHYILNFGANPYETHELYTGFINRLIEARFRKKAKLVTFDVRLSHTAGNSDEWFPIAPGTDGVVALAMANVIVSENLYHKEFIQRWTNVTPSSLSNYLSKFPPEMAQEISGIHASDIERIAKEFALSQSAVAITGRGISGHFNGVYNERCIQLLNILVGNIDAPGGYCFPRTYSMEKKGFGGSPKGKGISFSEIEEVQLTPKKFISLVKKGSFTPQLYFIFEANPAYNNSESSLTQEVLKNEKLVPHIIVADSHMTETALFADIILPTATYLESWALDSSPSLNFIPFIALQQPIIRPYGNSVPISDILIELAHRIGGDFSRSFKFHSTEDYLKKVISEIGPLEKVGGLNYLKENGIWFEPKAKPKYRSYESKGFNTPSGKIEIYSERLRTKGFNPYPVYEAIPDHGDLKGKFVLVTFESNVMGTRTPNFQWLSEIKHRNYVWMNRDVAKILHLEEGDRVKISSRIGSFEGEARFTFGIHPRVIAVERNLGHWGFGNIARAKKFKSQDPNTQLVWWEKEGNGFSPNQVISGNSDPIGGGEAWNDTLVTVTKV
ncbi:MAG: molybdopterin-containing oxidoreductase family protein [Thermodesulfobacteriota bacterium]